VRCCVVMKWEHTLEPVLIGRDRRLTSRAPKTGGGGLDSGRKRNHRGRRRPRGRKKKKLRGQDKQDVRQLGSFPAVIASLIIQIIY